MENEEKLPVVEQGNWDTDADARVTKGDSKVDWMKFPKPGTYKVRFVGAHVKFLTYPFKPFRGKRVITHKDYEGKDPAWKAGFIPSVNWAIFLLDRGDSNRPKVLQKGSSIFNALSEFKKTNDIDPTDKSAAPNFIIKVEWQDGTKQSAKYTVSYEMKPSPLTQEEKEMLKDVMLNDKGINVLKDIYKPTSLEKIQEYWSELPDSDRVPVKKEKDKKGNVESHESSAKPKSTQAVKRESPVVEEETSGGNDLFDGDNGDQGQDDDVPF